MNAELKAGRELDALVAERVMGWLVKQDDLACGRKFILSETHYECLGLSIVWSQRGERYRITGSPDELYPKASLVPRYSTDIAAAWSVVDKMRERGWSIEIRWLKRDKYSPSWVQEHPAVFFMSERQPCVAGSNDPTAPTMPLAICHAALAAVEGGSHA